MQGSWTTKTVLFSVAFVLSALLLVPTFYQAQIKEGTAPPVVVALDDFFRQTRITWGLDLQGGLHLQYQVDVDRALSDKLTRYGEELRRSIGEAHPQAQVTVERVTGAWALRIASTGTNTRDLLDMERVSLMNLNVSNEASGAVRLEMDQSYIDETRQYAVEQAIETIRKRIDTMGVAEPSISRRGDSDIIVQLPGLDEAAFEQTKDVIARTAMLEFLLVSAQSDSFLASTAVTADGLTQVPGNPATSASLAPLQAAYAGVTPPPGTRISFQTIETFNPTLGRPETTGYRPILVETTTSSLTGEYITDARVQNDPQTNWPVVSMTFDAEGARLFGQLTATNVDRQFAIILDGVVFSAPNINEPILGGRAQITMGRGGSYNETFASAEALTIVLRNGALPAPIEKQFETQVGPSLGRDSIRAGALSLALGFGLVMIFMLVYYKKSGIISVMVLVVNVVFIGSALAALGATLTLPGIAGITLTIGMAVDANIIIFERIKEELAKNRTPRQAVEAGYGKALSAVLDANITTGIAGLVLLEFGSGPVRGFAVTLLIGICSSLLTAVVASRLFFDYFVEGKKVTRLSI